MAATKRVRHLLLWGFMGSGKSAAGRLLARALGRPFIDLDAEIVAATGLSVAEIFSREGEAGFRALERAALRAALRLRTPAVIAPGGGALVANDNFRLANRHDLFLIEAPLDDHLRRLQGPAQRRQRPLAGSPARLRALWRARRPAMARVARRVDGRRPVPVVALQTLWALGEMNGRLPAEKTIPGLHPAQLGAGNTVPALRRITRSAKSPPVLITHPELAAMLPASLRRDLRVIAVPAGEKSKSPAALARLWNRLAALGVDRSTPVIGLGGGVIGDLAGFAAATYRRGVPFFLFPTTLTAMVDAALGGKTGIDLAAGKNLAGVFAAPRLTVIDTAWLVTLPPRELRSGLSELIKTAFLISPAAVAELERDLPALLAGHLPSLTLHVERATRYKLRLCAKDPRERGERIFLNLGHTLAHALEKKFRYEKITHGEAVAVGLVEEHRAAAALGLLPRRAAQKIAGRMEALLRSAGLPTRLREVGVNAGAVSLLRDAIRSDKKSAAGTLHWPLLLAPGRVRVIAWRG
jgi:shikimate kinase/3-dehydroquinate synthase